MMTGITRVSKESVFSDLNNLNVITSTSLEYETSFGFTESKILRHWIIWECQSRRISEIMV